MKSVFITGGAQGIGKAIAQAFLRRGDAVTLFDADAEAGRETSAELAPLGTVQFVHGSVADEDVVRMAIDAAVARFGGIDVLVNNAGVFDVRPITQTTLAEWRHVLDVNLTGAFLCARHASEALQQSRGAIVNIASTRAHMSEPDTFAYAASKGGLVALTHALAVSLGPDVRVNCVSPGWIDVSAWKKSSVRQPDALREIDHRQHPAGRVGRPEDVAAMVLFLSGEASGFVTGQEFVVDGGMTRKMIYAE